MSSLRCVAANLSMSPGRRSSLMSGWRRITPVPEQGASSRMRSKGRPSHQSSASRSPCCSVALQPQSLQVAGHALQAVGIDVDGHQLAKPGVRSRMWPLLPPGAAQASSTRSPACASSSGAAHCAPASCTLTSPALKPGSCGHVHRLLQHQRRVDQAGVRDDAGSRELRNHRVARAACWFTRNVMGGDSLLAAMICARACACARADGLQQPARMGQRCRFAAIDVTAAPPRARAGNDAAAR